jgi:CelD/BcsL family acetyltransferase involved in cellulose biosynthesis
MQYFDFLRGDEQYKREYNPEEQRSEHWTIRSTTTGMRYRIAQTAQRIQRQREQRRKS